MIDMHYLWLKKIILKLERDEPMNQITLMRELKIADARTIHKVEKLGCIYAEPKGRCKILRLSERGRELADIIGRMND